MNAGNTMERLGIEKTFFWSEMGAPDGDGSARHSTKLPKPTGDWWGLAPSMSRIGLLQMR